MSEARTERLGLVVHPGMRSKLERIAERHDVSVSHVIRQAIAAYLTDHPDLED